MNKRILIPVTNLLVAACLLSACASMEQLISAPGVSLRNVQVASLDYSAQMFVLSFDVTNPNTFPLPVKSVFYRVELDGQRFASGETEGSFTVPARSDSEFAISVELDLLRTAPQLLYVVRDGVNRDIPYELNGEFGVDIPFAKAVSFKSSGEIRLRAD